MIFLRIRPAAEAGRTKGEKNRAMGRDNKSSKTSSCLSSATVRRSKETVLINLEYIENLMLLTSIFSQKTDYCMSLILVEMETMVY